MIKQHEMEQEVLKLQSQLEKQRKENIRLKKELSRQEKTAIAHEPSAAKLSRSRLWSSISHEILTPMDAILGMTDLVMDTELTDEQRNYLEMINSSADRLFGVISDIIDYSELLEGKLRRDMVNFDIFEELEYDLYIAELSAKHKDLKFNASFSKDLPNYINSDPSRLRQVLNNIISNGLKFTHEGDIAVTVEKGGHDENGRLLLRFTVKDTGIGISQQAQQTIFQRPAPLTITGGEEKFSEGGLGLVVSALLVELFGGKIGVTSNEKGGSTFWFTWPVINPLEMYMGELPPDMFSDKRDRSLVLRGANILLAEDEYINASITKAFLEQVGLNVTTVENGKDAVDTAAKGGYHAVLMDVQMPVMDGLEATREIRKREREAGKSIPIIALTAHAMHGDKELCLQAGMDDYLAKPLDKDQLIEILARYMTRKALVVGSNPVSQHDIMQPLAERGWAVTLAETGRLAMYEASLSHYDMIVIDASLPVKDGIEAVRTIRKLEEFSGYRATIVGVGFLSEDEFRDYGTSGFDEFYDKKVMADALIRRVELFS